MDLTDDLVTTDMDLDSSNIVSSSSMSESGERFLVYYRHFACLRTNYLHLVDSLGPSHSFCCWSVYACKLIGGGGHNYVPAQWLLLPFVKWAWPIRCK